MYPEVGVALHLHSKKVLIIHWIESIKTILYCKIYKMVIKGKMFFLPKSPYCKFLYRQGVRMLTRGKNEHFLESSRRRNFHGEVASEWFGTYSLS
jgi:hypothetical protein